MKDYIKINQNLWNKKTPAHIASDFYDNEAFLAGKNTLNDIELALFPAMEGLKVLHSQCHFGQDSLSMARMGAEVTGVDFSQEAIAQARKMNDLLKLETQFIQANVLELEAHIPQNHFDMVFTSYGTVGWLDDIRLWAKQMSYALKPGGQLIFVEFHPAVWMFDDAIEKLTYPYLNAEVIIEQEEGTYADTNAQIHAQSFCWNYGLTEVLQALLDAGMRLDFCREYDYSPYNCFQGLIKTDKGYQFEKHQGILPMVYALKMTKN